MKLSKFARQNYILLALTLLSSLVVKVGLDDLAKNEMYSFGVVAIIFGGLATLGFFTALVVRLWEMD